MYQTNEPINHEQLPETFAKFFSEKINNLLKTVKIEDTVYNGKQRILPHSETESITNQLIS